MNNGRPRSGCRLGKLDGRRGWGTGYMATRVEVVGSVVWVWFEKIIRRASYTWNLGSGLQARILIRHEAGGDVAERIR